MNRWMYGALLLLILCRLCAAEEAAAKTEVETKAKTPRSDMLMSLDQCIQYAAQHKPSIKKSVIAVEQAKWQVITEKAKYAFNLSASSTQDLEDDTNNSSVTIRRSFPTDIDVSATLSKSETGNEGTASLKISKTILGGGTLDESEQGIRDSLLDELIAQNTHANNLRQLRLQITRAYYRVVRSKQTLGIQERQLERAKTNRERAVERDRLLDIANADIQVSDNKDRVLQAKLDIEEALDGLKREIGMPIEEDIDVSDTFEITIQEVDLADDWQYAQKNHVDFINLGLRMKKTDREIRIEKSQLLPTVNLDYEISQDSIDEFDFDGDTESSVGLSLSWQIGSASDKSAYQRALLRKEGLDIDWYDTTQSKLLELRGLNRELMELAQRIAIAEQKLKLQERSTALYADRYENGEIDILEYIRNQDALENERVSLLRLNIQYLEKFSEYQFAVGR